VKLLAYRIFDPVTTDTQKSSPANLKLVHRVHQFYEKLEREDVRKINSWEKHEHDKRPI